MDELQKKIEDAQAAGEEISPSWFYREKRLKNLLAQVERQIRRFGGEATRIIEREQREAIKIAVRQAEETFQLLTENYPDARSLGSTLNPRNVETAVGMMGDGSPIISYFEKQLAPLVAERIKSEVIKASAIGTNFKTIAKRLQETGGITKYRALSVARTEVNRVRRETTRSIYEDNADIIDGWEWVASKSSRTCPLCLAMDGKVFKLKEAFPQHVACRCTLIPVIEGLPRRKRTLGRDWFESQPDEVKGNILGKETFAAYRDNNLSLDDFVAFRNDKRFGKSVTRKPLAKILADKGVVRESKRTMKARQLAQDLLESAKRNEPSITRDLRRIADLHQAQTVGLKNKFKSEESLSRKLLDYSQTRDLSISAIAKRNNDTLRYTFLLPNDKYADGVEKIVEELKKRDYRIGKIFNAWKSEGEENDTGYRGINMTVISSQKQKFELQLHTRASFDLKKETHGLYEELRNPQTSAARKRKIIDLMIKKAAKLKRPKGM